MHRAAEQLIAAELRELSVYETILYYIASGYDKLNELHLKTGYSRAKISVYMKNHGTFHIVEKETSFETGGWENTKKGVYRIKDNYVNFWFRFVYPHLSFFSNPCSHLTDLHWQFSNQIQKSYIFHAYFLEIAFQIFVDSRCDIRIVELESAGIYHGDERRIVKEYEAGKN